MKKLNRATDSGSNIFPIRVLVVEDNNDDEELLRRQLKQAGMLQYVKFIQNGKDALNFLVTSKTSLEETVMAIFLDLKLPGLSGLKLLEELRAMGEFHSIPVIVMTSSNDPSDISRCHALRVANYIEKPVTLSAFSMAVADVFHTAPKESLSHGIIV